MAVQEYSTCSGRIDSLSTEAQEFVDSVFLSTINENDVKKVELIPTEYKNATKYIFLQEIDASPNVHRCQTRDVKTFRVTTAAWSCKL